MKLQCLAFLVLAACSSIARADIYRYVDQEGVTVYTDIPRPERRQVVILRDGRRSPVEAARPLVGADLQLLRARYAGYVREAAAASDVEPALIHAVISAESGYNPVAQSRKGALGLMQLMPETAKRYRVANPLDPAQNILGGARYLKDLLSLFHNDLKLVIAAYNAGEAAVMRYGNRVPPYAETAAYVPRVMAYYSRYQARQ